MWVVMLTSSGIDASYTHRHSYGKWLEIEALILPTLFGPLAVASHLHTLVLAS